MELLNVYEYIGQIRYLALQRQEIKVSRKLQPADGGSVQSDQIRLCLSIFSKRLYGKLNSKSE